MTHCVICGQECETNQLQSKQTSDGQHLYKIINSELFNLDNQLLFFTDSDSLCIICEKLCMNFYNFQENSSIRDLLKRQITRTYELGNNTMFCDLDYEALQSFSYKCHECSYATDIFENLSPHFLFHKLHDLETENEKGNEEEPFLVAEEITLSSPTRVKQTASPEIVDYEQYHEIALDDNPDVKEQLQLIDLNTTFPNPSCHMKDSEIEIKKEMLPETVDDVVDFKKCDFCEFDAPNSDSMLRHISQNHTRSDDDDCEKLSPQNERQIRNRICSVCGFKYIEKPCKHLQAIEYKLPRLECQKCGEIFYMKHLLAGHKRKKHFICVHCSKECSARKELLEHSIIHKKDKEKMECSWCDKVFSGLAGLRIHTISHTGQYKYSCEICDKRFAARISWDEHMSWHNNKPQYVCVKCGKGFFSSSTFRVHRMWHIDNNPFKCEHCPKEFRTSSSLVKHRRIEHLNQAFLFKCRHCDQRFKSRIARQRHETGHTGIYKYNCKICKKGFAVKLHYARHLMRIHGDDSVINDKKVCEYKMAIPPWELANERMTKNSEDNQLEEFLEIDTDLSNGSVVGGIFDHNVIESEVEVT